MNQKYIACLIQKLELDYALADNGKIATELT